METLTETNVAEALKQCHCGRLFSESQSSGKTCFPCKLDTVGFTWRGPTRASKQNFHDYTIGEVARSERANAQAMGNDITPIGQRWV